MQGFPITRRAALGGAAALPFIPRARAQPAPVNLVLESEVVILDPHATTAAITRTFATHVFDTLFAMDGQGMIRPQMVEAWERSADGLVWEFRLRPGLRWHDGAPVTAQDCVASLERWAPRDSLGRMLWAAKATLAATDARSFRLTLRRPFPLVLDVLGKPNAPLPVMLPERLARIPVEQRIREPVGSGPFRFRTADWRPGDVMLLDRFDGYVPREEPADFLAGGKRVHLPAIALRVMPDQATGAAALMAGEVDYMQYLPFDLLPRLERARGVRLAAFGGIHMFQGNFRLNHAASPMDDPAIRRVLWRCADQAAILTAIGVPDRFRAPACPSFFLCDAPLASRAGAAEMAFDPAEARRMLAATGYRGEKLAFLTTAGGISQTAAQVMIQEMQRAGFAVEEQLMDWGTLLARRAKHEGWHMFAVYSNGTDMFSPLTHFYVANTCADYPGWDCDRGIEALLREFAEAVDAGERRRLAEAIQQAEVRHVPNVMWGQFTIPAGIRDRLRDVPPAAYPMFWEARV
ncbi:ABC transporter substrate-binding protein [Paracraurococcus ruber]|uniref:Substrate-binding protein n=1 Tax=Paracraurococcus ruber TaxID=77675 RepID=A0ABS1D3M5_9PROT|nr:ABC transporter substrate-binding protein [Paracraurococcus ruber]MBK1661156.1 substrate-binding protein [Paracraurococcus ruber]TDG24959.1 ABC transporter substrate-binding protein [Paracraurococcus ruber]